MTIVCVIQHCTTILNRRTLQRRALSFRQICSQQRAYRKFSTFADALTAYQLNLLTYSSADTTNHWSTGSHTTTNQRLREGFVGCYLCRRPHEILLLVNDKIYFRFDSKAATAKCKLKSDNLIFKTITRGEMNCIAQYTAKLNTGPICVNRVSRGMRLFEAHSLIAHARGYHIFNLFFYNYYYYYYYY